MKTLLLLAAIACAPVVSEAQARSSIPIKIQKVHVDTVHHHDTVTRTVVIVRVDTLRDTVRLATDSLLAIRIETDTVNCGRVYIPIPIPIPIRRGRRTSSEPVKPVDTFATPEPSTFWLMFTGISSTALLLSLVRRK